jgi:BolA family transcriptional regulator, general stress-responsive regulator
VPADAQIKALRGGPSGDDDMRIARAIRQRLSSALAPSHLALVDQSAQHIGHAGARPEGESHFQLTIVAEAFEGKSRIERQRMVFGALGDLMQTDIHAFSITALTPDEAATRR